MEKERSFNDLSMSPTSAGYAGKAFPDMLVNDVEKKELLSIAKAILHKDITSYMVGILNAYPDAAVIVAPLWLLLWNFQAFLPPNSLNSFMAAAPAFYSALSCEPAISVSATVTCKSIIRLCNASLFSQNTKKTRLLIMISIHSSCVSKYSKILSGFTIYVTVMQLIFVRHCQKF